MGKMEKPSSLCFWWGHHIAYKLLGESKCPKYSLCVVHSTNFLLYLNYVLKSKGTVIHVKNKGHHRHMLLQEHKQYLLLFTHTINYTYQKLLDWHLEALPKKTKILKLLVLPRVSTLLTPIKAKLCLHTQQIGYFTRAIPIFFSICAVCHFLKHTGSPQEPLRLNKVKGKQVYSESTCFQEGISWPQNIPLFCHFKHNNVGRADHNVSVNNLFPPKKSNGILQSTQVTQEASENTCVSHISVSCILISVQGLQFFLF